MGFEWSENQKKVIEYRNRDILVSAAAGSGKTAVLVERIISMITDKNNPIDVDRLLVVTFTKAAAAEMRKRISGALEERLSANPGDRNIERQLSLIHNAKICTIDSFCSDLIKNYFHVIGLDPDLKVADENELNLMKEEIFNDLIEKKLEEENKKEDSVFLRLFDTISEGKVAIGKIKEVVFNLHRIAKSNTDFNDCLKRWESYYYVPDLESLYGADFMREASQEIYDILDRADEINKEANRICSLPGGPGYRKEMMESEGEYIQKLLSFYKEKEEGLELDWDEFYEALISFSFKRIVPYKKNESSKEMADKVKNLRDEYKAMLSGIKTAYFPEDPSNMLATVRDIGPMVSELYKLVAEFDLRYGQEKEEAGIMDFSDMEHYAMKILLHKTEEGKYTISKVAKELQAYYKEVLIDEYQDSNYIQEYILKSITSSKDKPPYMFMVGDVKQSIYQFRLARPKLFMKKYKKYREDDEKECRIDLNSNYRSRARVLDFCNVIFREVMREKYGGIEYDEKAELVAGADIKEENDDKKTEIILIDKDCFLEDEMEDSPGEIEGLKIKKSSYLKGDFSKEEVEAMVVGQRIKEMVNGNKPMLIKDGDGFRPVRYGDIVILLRSARGWSESFQKILSEMGIPVYSPTKSGYFATYEVSSLLNFLRVIDNPRQDIPLASVMRSVFCDFTDDDLGMLGSLKGGINFWDKILLCRESEDLSEDLKAKIERFVGLIDFYRDFSKDANIYELLSDIYDRTFYYDIVSSLPLGSQRQANLDILLERAVSFENAGHVGISNFCRHIDSLKKSDVDFGEAQMGGELANTVQIMTIHKSKGLEFPVCFLAGAGKEFNQNDSKSEVICDMDYGAGMNWMDFERRLKKEGIIKKSLKNHVIKSTKEEEIRVLYVALTRAKEKLIVTGSMKKLFDSMIKIKEGYENNGLNIGGAMKYLDWILPVISQGDSYQFALEALENGNASTVAEDDLLVIRAIVKNDIIREEVKGLKNSILQKKDLLEMDFDKTYDKDLAEAFLAEKNFVYPYERIKDIPAKITVSEVKRRMNEMESALPEEDLEVRMNFREESEDHWAEDEIPRPGFLKEEKTISGTNRGSLYHLAFEHFPFENHKDVDCKEYLDKLVDRGYISEGERKSLYWKDFLDFSNSKICDRMSRACIEGKLFREQPFMFKIRADELFALTKGSDEAKSPEFETNNRSLKGKETLNIDFKKNDNDFAIDGEFVVLQGIIDAYFIEDDKIILLDYKTDKVRETAELVDRYHVQLDYYARALESLTGMKVEEKLIYSVNKAEIVEC